MSTLIHDSAAAALALERAFERMWLAATKRNIGVHPMAVLSYLFARLIRGDGNGLDPDTIEDLRRVRARYEKVFQLSSATAEVMLFRVGFANSTAKRSLRRPIEDVWTTCRVSRE